MRRRRVSLVLCAGVLVTTCLVAGWFLGPKPPAEMARRLADSADRSALVSAGQGLLGDPEFVRSNAWRYVDRSSVSSRSGSTIGWDDLPKCFRDLPIQGVVVQPRSIWLQSGGGLGTWGLIVVAPGFTAAEFTQGSTARYTLLEDGLWSWATVR